MTSNPPIARPPAWLRALSGCVLLVLAVAVAYAAAVALANLSQIGV